MTLDNKFWIQDMVILKHDVEKHKRMVTRMTINVDGVITYELSCGNTTSLHYDFEMEKVNGSENKVGFR